MTNRSLKPALALALLMIPVGPAGALELQPDEIALWTLDTDGDSVPDTVELLHRTDPLDPYSAPDVDLTDRDGDLVPDATEALHGTDPLRAEEFPVPVYVDSDGDGTFDTFERLSGSDPFDPADRGPLAAVPQESGAGSSDGREVAPRVGFPTATCRPGFRCRPEAMYRVVAARCCRISLRPGCLSH